MSVCISRSTKSPALLSRLFVGISFFIRYRGALLVGRDAPNHSRRVLYSPLGIFGVFISPIHGYGEGKANAVRGLRNEIIIDRLRDLQEVSTGIKRLLYDNTGEALREVKNAKINQSAIREVVNRQDARGF